MSMTEGPADKHPLPAGVGQPEGFREEGTQLGGWALKDEEETVQ